MTVQLSPSDLYDALSDVIADRQNDLIRMVLHGQYKKPEAQALIVQLGTANDALHAESVGGMLEAYEKLTRRPFKGPPGLHDDRMQASEL